MVIQLLGSHYFCLKSILLIPFKELFVTSVQPFRRPIVYIISSQKKLKSRKFKKLF